VKRVTLAAALLFIVSSAFGQLRSINAFGSYVTAIDKRAGFMEIRGFGGGVEGRIALSGNLSLNISFGYERYGDIKQDSSLVKWNWRFWNERYAGNVRLDTLSDTLKAILNPVQSMETLPLLVSLSLDLEPFERFTIRQSIGGGVLFFTRSLYLHEEWKKRFRALDQTFEYDFRNFAPDKKGNPLVVTGAVEMSYRIFTSLAVSAHARYFSVIRTAGSFGYDTFPMNDALSLSIGVNFLY